MSFENILKMLTIKGRYPKIVNTEMLVIDPTNVRIIDKISNVIES